MTAHAIDFNPVRPEEPQVFVEAPSELTSGRLRRIGEGIGRVVYASENWVVKRERTPRETIALIILWRMLRAIERAFPTGIAKRLMERPSRQIRFLRVVIQTVMLIVPRSIVLRSSGQTSEGSFVGSPVFGS